MSGNGGADLDALARARRWLREADRILALTGAGISTESGIPDFRGPQGLWTRDPEAEKLSNIHYYMSDPEVRRKAWRSRLASPAWEASPNAGQSSADRVVHFMYAARRAPLAGMLIAVISSPGASVVSK